MLRPSLLLASALAALLALPSNAAPSTATQAVVLDAADPAAAPAAACTIRPSPKDTYRLLTIATDPTCAQHGLGCVSDVCRYCRLKRDEAYSNLLICSAIEGFGSGDGFDPSDVIDGGPAFTLQCATTVSAGDAAVGINIATDVSCTLGGVGCLSDLCRYCKVRDTPQSASFLPCSAVDTNNGDDVFFTPLPVVGPDATDGPVIGSTDRPTLDVIPISALTTTSAPTTTTTAPAPTTARPTTTAPPTAAPVTTAPPTAAPVTTTPPTAAPVTTAPPTAAPVTTAPPTTAPPTTAPPTTRPPTTAPPTTAPPPTTVPPTTAPPVATGDACAASVSWGDQNVGVSAYTDAACRTGGLGCFSTACRFCKKFESPQSSQWLPCPTSTTVAPAPTTLPPAPTTRAPVPTTTAPPVTLAPVTPAPTTRDACAASVSSGDNAVGIFGFTDARCQSGGLGCFSTACRFCKGFDTPQSSYLLPCPSAPAPAPVPATQAPVATTTAPPSPPPPTTAAPTPAPTRDACAASVSSGDNNVGISAYTDAACRSGGLGCFGTTCRFCKTFDSPQSQQFLACPRA